MFRQTARITSANLAPIREEEHTPLCVSNIGGQKVSGGRDSQPSVGLSVHLFMKVWKDIFVADELCDVVASAA